MLRRRRLKDYKVTVICTAFNHGRFIEQTIKGFLMQKTDFAFKVILHDDASKDDTRRIIEKYAKAYPDIIVPILQEENCYSKGIKITDKYILPLVDTEYIAFCEGDDFWTDENKLQMQYDYMQQNPDCVMCTHNTDLINAKDDTYIRTLNACMTDRDYSADEIILARGGQLFHTSSFFMKTQYRRDFLQSLRIKSVGDYPLAVYLSLCGKVHYFGKVMSSYRTGVEGSWTVRTYSDKKKVEEFYDNLLDYLKRLDSHTNGAHAEAIRKVYDVNSLLRLRYLGEYKKILKDRKMRKILKDRPHYEKKEIWLRGLVPFAFEIKKKLKRIMGK